MIVCVVAFLSASLAPLQQNTYCSMQVVGHSGEMPGIHKFRLKTTTVGTGVNTDHSSLNTIISVTSSTKYIL